MLRSGCRAAAVPMSGFHTNVSGFDMHQTHGLHNLNTATPAKADACKGRDSISHKVWLSMD